MELYGQLLQSFPLPFCTRRGQKLRSRACERFFFCGEEEEEVQIMEELVVFVRDTMNMFVAESQGR